MHKLASIVKGVPLLNYPVNSTRTVFIASFLPKLSLPIEKKMKRE